MGTGRCCSATHNEAPSSVHAPIPPILYSIIAPAIESSCDLSPPFSHLGNQTLNQQPFFRADWFMI
jgi:hypothetical protein